MINGLKFEYRQLTRNGYCRLCNKTIDKNTDKAIVFYSHANQGSYVILCKNCVDAMNWYIENNIA